MFSLKTGRVVTRKWEIQEILMPTWFIQPVETLSMYDGGGISDGNELLFVDQYSNENGFSATLHEGGIARLAQYDNDQDYNNDNYCSNMDEDTDDPSGISLEPAAARG